MIFLQPDSKSSSRSKLHLQPILSFYITIFMPVILSLFIRIYTVAENFSPEHPFRQETQIQIQYHQLPRNLKLQLIKAHLYRNHKNL